MKRITYILNKKCIFPCIGNDNNRPHFHFRLHVFHARLKDMTTDVFLFILFSYAACHMFLEFRINIRSVIIHVTQNSKLRYKCHVGFSSVNRYKLHILSKIACVYLTFNTEQCFYVCHLGNSFLLYNFIKLFAKLHVSLSSRAFHLIKVTYCVTYFFTEKHLCIFQKPLTMVSVLKANKIKTYVQVSAHKKLSVNCSLTKTLCCVLHVLLFLIFVLILGISNLWIVWIHYSL